MVSYVMPAWQSMLWQETGSVPPGPVDVLVLGGGLGGCAAAIAAARTGLHVVLVESGHLLGGQMSASGVGASDVWASYFTMSETGLWGEFVKAVNQIYDREMNGKSTATNGYAVPAFAASATIVDRALMEMCLAAGVEVVRNVPALASLTVTGRSAQARFGDSTLTAAVVVDATEDGAGLVAAGFPYRLGSQTGAADRVPATSRIQDITYPAVVRRFEPGAVPDQLVMPQPPKYQVYRPGIAKWYPRAPWTDASDVKGFAGFRGLPDLASDDNYTAVDFARITRTSINYINDAQATSQYLTDPAYRATLNRNAILSTLAVIYYLQQELGLGWAIADDEGFADGPSDPERAALLQDLPSCAQHLPLRAYVRESRRLMGQITLTYDSVGRTPTRRAGWREDVVAVCTYPYDIHGSTAAADFEADLGESSLPPQSTGAIPIPLGALVPSDARRLIAAEKNISVSRTVNGAVRVHPSVMATGQAAGVIAAGTVKLNLAPKDVPVTSVQAELLKQGALLLPGVLAGASPGSDTWITASLGLLQKDPWQFSAANREIRSSSPGQLSAWAQAGRNRLPSAREKLS